MASFQDYLNVLKSGTIFPRIKIEWLRPDETVESEIVEDILSGNLTINRNNGVRRVIDFTVKNSSSLLPNIYNIWINKKVRLSIGVQLPNGEDYLIPQGIFILRNPVYTSSPSGSTVTFNAVDKFGNLNGENGYGILQDIFIISGGTNVNTAIQTILTTFKDPITPNLQPTTKTLPYDIRKGQTDNVGAMLNEIVYAVAKNGYYDTYGRFTVFDDIADDKKASLWDYNFQDDKYCYLGSTIEHQFNLVRNVVKVIGDNSSATGLIATGVAKDTDLTSPTNIYAIGEIPEVVQNNYIQTNADALNLANFMLKRLRVLNGSIDIESITIPHLDVDNIITITDDNLGLYQSRFLIQFISMDLGFGGKMRVQCVKSAEEDFTVGKVG